LIGFLSYSCQSDFNGRALQTIWYAD